MRWQGEGLDSIGGGNGMDQFSSQVFKLGSWKKDRFKGCKFFIQWNATGWIAPLFPIGICAFPANPIASNNHP